MGRLDGKVAVITGAGSGIARAAASIFTREGAQVLTEVNTEDAIRLMKSLDKYVIGEITR